MVKHLLLLGGETLPTRLYRFSGQLKMTDQIQQSDINNAAWAACDTFRGVMDGAQYKDYILVVLFLKYISDVWKDHYEEYKAQYSDDGHPYPSQAGT